MGQGKSREIRTKIKSVKNTQKITKAMKLVSASKLRKAAQEIEKLRPYMQALSQMFCELDQGHDLSDRGTGNKAIVVVFAGERALCGSFNVSVVKSGIALGEELTKEGYSVQYVAIGKKAAEGLKNRGLTVLRQFNLTQVIPSVEFSREISAYLEDLTVSDGVSKVVMAYTEFKSAMSKKLKSVQFLPFDPRQFISNETQQAPVQQHSLYEPSRSAVISEIKEQLLKGLLHQCYMDSLASEYGSRMVAMDNASRNCKELTNKLTLRLNRERQASITQEIAEIVGGAAGLQ